MGSEMCIRDSTQERKLGLFTFETVTCSIELETIAFKQIIPQKEIILWGQNSEMTYISRFVSNNDDPSLGTSLLLIIFCNMAIRR